MLTFINPSLLFNIFINGRACLRNSVLFSLFNHTELALRIAKTFYSGHFEKCEQVITYIYHRCPTVAHFPFEGATETGADSLGGKPFV